jgi:hypothetical protein
MASPLSARNRAQSYFKSSEQRENVIRDEIEKERAAVAAKTARLRALRLAKETEDKIEADRLAAEETAKEASIAVRKPAKKVR